jgi:DNA-directed RNA polymerase specialized sigma24 family protein
MQERNDFVLRSNQEQATEFDLRFGRCYRLLHFIAFRVLGDFADVDLAIHNCRRTASRNPLHFQYEGAFRSWLLRVLIDEALALLRERQQVPDSSSLGRRRFYRETA